MVNLDWKIGNVTNDNDALISGAFKDITTLGSDTAGSAMNVISPSAHALIDNTATLGRKPFKTAFTAENYGKLAKTVPAIPADVVMKWVRLPVSFIDNFLTYGINNNLQRGITATKSLTTGLVSNIITNNGQTRFKALKLLWGLVEGAWDVIGTLIKTPTGTLAAGTSIVDKYLAKGTTATQEFVEGVRITDQNFLTTRPFINTADMPQAANNNHSIAHAA